MTIRVDKSITLEALRRLNHIEIDCGKLGILSEERGDKEAQCDLCKASGCLWFLVGDTVSGFCDICMLKLISML